MPHKRDFVGEVSGGGGEQKTKVYVLSGQERIRQGSDDGKALKYCAQYPGVMQGSQEGKRTNLWGPCAHFGANIPMKIGHNHNNNKFIQYITILYRCYRLKQQ